jgi:hypothetical protein
VAVLPVIVHSANEIVLPVPILYAKWGGIVVIIRRKSPDKEQG